MDKEMEERVHKDVEMRVREGLKAVLEQILDEEMLEHLQADKHERTATRQGERNGTYKRDLLTGAGQIHGLRVPRDRGSTFYTELFERYKRATGSVEEAVLEMYLQGVSTRKVAAITEALSGKRVGKDAVSRITQRLGEAVEAWSNRHLEEAYPYLYLDATYLKANWGGKVVGVAVLAAVGVSQNGQRELLALEPATGEKAVAYQGLLRGLLDRGLSGVRLVVSDDHEAIKSAVGTELPGVDWQRCVVHFQRNVLAHVSSQAQAEVAADLKAVFAVSRKETAHTLAEAFVKSWQKKFPKAVAVFEGGIRQALVYLDYPTPHHTRIRTTNGLERLFQELKRRTRVVGVFPNEQSLRTLTTAVGMRVTEEWALRTYLSMAHLTAQDRLQQQTPEFPQNTRR